MIDIERGLRGPEGEDPRQEPAPENAPQESAPHGFTPEEWERAVDAGKRIQEGILRGKEEEIRQEDLRTYADAMGAIEEQIERESGPVSRDEERKSLEQRIEALRTKLTGDPEKDKASLRAIEICETQINHPERVEEQFKYLKKEGERDLESGRLMYGKSSDRTLRSIAAGQVADAIKSEERARQRAEDQAEKDKKWFGLSGLVRRIFGGREKK